MLEVCAVFGLAIQKSIIRKNLTNEMYTTSGKDSHENFDPYQIIRLPEARLEFPAHENRAKTVVLFNYYSPSDGAFPTFLQINNGKQYKDLALVDHPLLSKLTMPSVKESNYQLFQRVQEFASIDDFIDYINRNKVKLTADKVAAENYKLGKDSYIPLENLIDLSDTDYILTSYLTPIRIGKWSEFRHTFNLSDYQPNEENKIEGRIVFLTQKDKNPYFYIGEVHVNYKQNNSSNSQ